MVSFCKCKVNQILTLFFACPFFDAPSSSIFPYVNHRIVIRFEVIFPEMICKTILFLALGFDVYVFSLFYHTVSFTSFSPYNAIILPRSGLEKPVSFSLRIVRSEVCKNRKYFFCYRKCSEKTKVLLPTLATHPHHRILFITGFQLSTLPNCASSLIGCCACFFPLQW